MRRVYIETSVWGMVAPDQAATLREPTLELLTLCADRLYLPHISDVVSDEIALAPPATQEHVLREVKRVNPLLLSLSPEVDALAQRFIDQGIVPARRIDDARHVACAIVNDLDLLVSWNYRHIANVRKAEGFNAVAVLAGFGGDLQIHTPLEVLEWK